jgi:VWFA-related protein
MGRKRWRLLSYQAMFLTALLGAALPLAAAQAQPQAQPSVTVKNPADQTAPKNPPDQTQDSSDEIYKLPPVVVHEVTTPVTVLDSGGNFVYDLEQNEFKIYDNGQLQDIRSFSTEMNHLSLVIIVETNESTAPFLDSVRPLASLFSDMVMGPQGDVAVITYSDRVNLALDFTSDGDKLDTVLRGLQGRGSGMHLDDAMTAALSKLLSRPISDRKVIIAFSDGFNIGSKMHRSEIVKGAMNANITVYHLGFSPLKGLWKRPAKDPPPDLVAESVGRGVTPNAAPTPTNEMNIWDTSDINIVSILLGLGEEAKKPIFKDSMIYYARYSGGRSFQKWDKNTVQTALTEIGAEIHSQYTLSYSPTKPIAPGYHKIEVEVRRPGAKVRARTGWVYQSEDVPRGVVVR